MENLEVINFEEHIIENKNCLLVGIKRKHSYEKLTDASITFSVGENVILNIEKGNLKKEYLLNLNKSIINKFDEIMIVEISKELGSINYIAIKN